MELATLEITKEEAEDRLRAYEAQLADERTAEDEAIRAGYRAAARGLPVVQMTKCIERGGWFDNGLPRIAVIRADAKQCWVSINQAWNDTSNCTVIYRDTERDNSRGALVGNHHVRVRSSRPEIEPRQRAWGGQTIVPVIPPDIRPKRSRIRGFHILWEVEGWTKVVPRDPALIRHIRGDLWSVVATWELTDLERAVLSAR